MTVWTTKVQFPCLWTDLNNFFSLTWKFDGDSKSDIVLSPNDSQDHKCPISLFMDRFELFFFYLETRWGFQIKYCTFPQMTNWTTKVHFLVYGPIWIIFFSFAWKFDGDSKSDIVLSLKWLTGPQKSNFFWYLELRYLWMSLSLF